MAAGLQVRLLLWKDYLIRKRKLITLGGIIWATAVMLSLYIVRTNIDNQDFPTCQFAARALPSAGLLTFLQSFICNVNNECLPMDQYQEIPTFEKSKLTQLERQFSPLLYNETVMNTAATVPDALKLLATLSDVVDQPTFIEISKNGLKVQDLFRNPTRVRRYLTSRLNITNNVVKSVMESEISFQGLINGNMERCNPNSLSETLAMSNSEHLKLLSEKLCSLPTDELHKILIDLLLNIDFGKYIKMVGDMIYKLSGDDGVIQLSKTTMAILRITNVHSFVPPELLHIIYGEGSEFSYLNIPLINKFMDLFKPTFGDTKTYQALRDFTDTLELGFQYINQFLSKINQDNSKQVSVKKQVIGKLDIDKNLQRVSEEVNNVMEVIEEISVNESSFDIFEILAKFTNFIYKWLPSKSKHDVIFYSTLLAKLIEGANKVITINMNIEHVTYNASLRHPDGVKILTALPADIIEKSFEALADAERTQVMTSKINNPGQMFCDTNILQGFLKISKLEADTLKKQLCSDTWQSYVSDLIRSFGIYEVKDNINAMASLLIQETLGKDTSSYIYTIDQSFIVLQKFCKNLINLSSEVKLKVEWNKLINLPDDSTFMKIVREKGHLGKQMLITVHGAFAKEIVKQNPILEFKIKPILIDMSTLVEGLNLQLDSSAETNTGFKEFYPLILETILRTAIDEQKTYKSLSTPSEEIVCNGVENALQYLTMKPSIDQKSLVLILCNATIAIETGLKVDSHIGKAINSIRNSTKTPFEEVQWTKLINGIKEIYLKLDRDYPYLFKFSNYGMDENTKKNIEVMFKMAQDFWFGKHNIHRGVHLSVKLVFRLLDVLDHEIFNITDETWMKMKYAIQTISGPLTVFDEFIKIITALSTNESRSFDLPVSTVTALSGIVPNIPQLIIDEVNIVIEDNTDLEPIIYLVNADPPWPCSDTSLSDLLNISKNSKNALKSMETIFCMDRNFRQEWVDYIVAKNLTLLNMTNWNTTVYHPHLFLDFSSIFDSLLETMSSFKDMVKNVFKGYSDDQRVTFASAIKYAINALNTTDRDDVLRNFFNKMDKLLDSVNVSSNYNSLPLNIIWEKYITCNTSEECRSEGRTTWTYTLKFLSVIIKNIASDLLKYFTELNEPNSNLFQLFGFTKNTGLYALHDKLSDFASTLLNSYSDYGFMSQIRRASQTSFWDCEAVLMSLVPPPGSHINMNIIKKVQPYICPSLLHWLSLPRGENTLLDLIAKPQYYFFSLEAKNLTTNYEDAFLKIAEVAQLFIDLANKNISLITKDDIKLNTIEGKLENLVNTVMSYNVNIADPSYILFNEVNRKQYISIIYLTRIVTITNRLVTAIENINMAEELVNISEEDLIKYESDLSFIQSMFKRKPSEVIALHFDLLTDMIWTDRENYTVLNALDILCNNYKNGISRNILVDDDNERVKTQLCSKNYDVIYGAIERDKNYTKKARDSLLKLVDVLKSDDVKVNDITLMFRNRKQVTMYMKKSIKIAYDLGIPIYLKYLQSNIQHYNIILSFLSGDNWWLELRKLYNGPNANEFFESLEKSFVIVEEILSNIDKIHFVRLLRDINLNDTEMFCMTNISLSDYMPDSTGIITKLKHQLCKDDKTDLFKELPPFVFASQGYDKALKLSKDVNYTALDIDLTTVEGKLEKLENGPAEPQRPHWVTDEKILKLKKVALRLLSKDTLTKISFGILSNIVDASTLFLNNSHCTRCSQFTTWFKQLNLHLFKKQEYDNLYCHMNTMSLQDIHQTLNNDFHWDMTFRELILTRNYTKYELNKSINQFIDQVKLHVLEDLNAKSTKLSECLAHNVSRNAFGNVTLFINVLAYTAKLLRAELPHLYEVKGITEVQFFKQLSSEIAHNIDIWRPLKEYLNIKNGLLDELINVLHDKELADDIKYSEVNLRLLHNKLSLCQYLKIPNNEWKYICKMYNCKDVELVIERNLNLTLISQQLPNLQNEEFWRFSFISNILHHIEELLLHMGRLMGIASKMDIEGALAGKVGALLDLIINMLMDNKLHSIMYSIKGILEELRPLLRETLLEYDLESLADGLIILQEYRNYIVKNMELKLPVSELFSHPDRLEMAMNKLGINNTNFWSIAAPRIHVGYLNLKPIFAPNQGEYHISSFVCQTENMSKVIVPSNVDVVTLDDVYGAVAEQFCNLSDEQAKQIIPVLLANLNFSFVVDKVTSLLLLQLYEAADLTEAEGETVLANIPQMAFLLPIVQENVGNLSETLMNDPLLQKLKDFTSVGNLLTSSQFVASAGNLLCGTPFQTDENRFYKAIADTKDFSNKPDQMQLDVLPTDFCRSLYKDILNMGGGKIIWSFVKPLIMGKILYTPPTATVRRIIEKANSTFSLMVRLTNLVHSFANAFSSVDKLSEHREGILVLRRLMTSPAFEDLKVMLIGDGEVPDVDVDGIFDEFGDLKGIGALLTKASDLLHCVNLNRFKAVDTEQQLTHEAVLLTRVDEFSAGLVFTNITEENGNPVNVEYKIRMDIESVPTTTRIKNQFWTPGPESNFLENMRYFRGFIQIQDIIDKAIIQLQNTSSRIQKREVKEDDTDWAVYTQQTPYPCYRKDFFQSSLYESQALIVAFFFSLLFTVSSAVRFIVAEKETGNTMLMWVMGVPPSRPTVSWVVASLLEAAVASSCMVAVLCAGRVLPRTDPSLMLAMLLVFGFSVIMFCYMMSKLFNSASFAAVCTALVYLVTFMPFVIILSLEAVLTYTAKIFTCLSMSTAFSYSLLYVARYEAAGTGAGWSDLWRSPERLDNMSIGVAMTMVLFDGLLYLIIGCIIERFFGLKTLKSSITYCTTTGEKAGVSIVNVTKIYGERSRAPKVALDNVSIELQKGQITTLLGHNGAGKTTLINILTGMLKPTKGHVIIRSEQKSGTTLGVCPQRDVLYEQLSAKEHMVLFAQLKSGKSLTDMRDEIDGMLQVLSLGALSHEPVYRLSGGTRRRLMVALAFLAHPQLVSLDEPTAGVDPGARRDIWSLILKLKEDRTVLLTTHHLDEAELLSDQIIIMHKGQIHTIGSPIEIKRSLGNGYKLTVIYPENDTKGDHWTDDDDEEITMEERTKQLLTTVKDVIKNAQLVDVDGLEIEITLPFFDSNGLNNNFLELCTTLEARQSVLGYYNYIMDCSSLEQVFFNITQQCDVPSNSIADATVSTSSLSIPSKSTSNSSIRNDCTPLVDSDGPIKGTAWDQFFALIHIRFLHYIRNRWLLFLLIVLPSLFVAIAMGFSMIRPPADNEIALKLIPTLYGNSTEFLIPRTQGQSDDFNQSFAKTVMTVLMSEKENLRNWTTKDSPDCKCAETRQECMVKDDYINDEPEMIVFPNVDTLNNWLIASQDVYVEKRYGGYTSSLKNNVTNLIAWYNNKGHHAMPAFVNALNSAILKVVSGNRNASISTYTHPLKISHEQLSKSTVLQHVADAGISGMLLIAYSLVAAGGAVYLVAARRSRQRRLQLLCGVSPLLYWTAALLWDIIIMGINILITVCVLEAFGFPVFVAKNNLPAICLLLLLFGYACGSFIHLFEKLFTEPSLANMIMFCANVFLGLAGITILLILDLISQSVETDNARWTLHKVFMIFPQFVLGDALLEIAKNTVQAQVLSRFGMDTYKDPLGGELIIYHYLALLLVGTVLTMLNLAVEYDCFEYIVAKFSAEAVPNSLEGEMEPLEVAAERKRVQACISHTASIARPVKLQTIGNINAGFVDTEGKRNSIKQIISPVSDVAQCLNLGKAYKTMGGQRVAVRNLTIGIPPGQCIALLGQNGAGKSTTFSMLTGEIRPTTGKIYLNEKEVNSRQLCEGLISYCPQSDAIDSLLTVRETLLFYCRLRGLSDSDEVIQRTLEMFDLSKYADVRNGTLSGGNKRKLCTAIAFMGRTPLVLLDEPTSGMDAVSRARVSRGVRAAVRARGSARGVLLATHALHDARRAAHAAALLSAGTLVALAPLRDCLYRSGGGYAVSCRVRGGGGGGGGVWRRVAARAPHAAPAALHAHQLQLHIPSCATLNGKEVITRVSDIFRLMAELQGSCDIEDYTINQSSLDQMFLKIIDKTDSEDIDLEQLPTLQAVRRNSEELNSITFL